MSVCVHALRTVMQRPVGKISWKTGFFKAACLLAQCYNKRVLVFWFSLP